MTRNNRFLIFPIFQMSRSLQKLRCYSSTMMEEAISFAQDIDKTFNELVKESQNGVQNLVDWLQEAKIVETSQEAADKAKQMFSGVQDQSAVTLDEFKAVISAMAEEQKTTFDQISKTLTEQAPKIVHALSAAATAFKEGMK